jgi:hypothetical protein
VNVLSLDPCAGHEEECSRQDPGRWTLAWAGNPVLEML